MEMTYNSRPVEDDVKRIEPLGQIIGETRSAQMETMTFLADILTILTGDDNCVDSPRECKSFMDSCALNRELAVHCMELARKIRATFGG